MGFLSSFKEGFDSERKKAINVAKERRKRNCSVVKLVDHNYGETVTLQVVAEEPEKHMFIDMLTSVGNYKNAEVEVNDNIVKLTFSDANLAELFRSSWRID